ncbi:MAG: hypothetical protein F4137_20740 [Acidobacteria bacterium]|nr:hypothetical protein [Acidobacteriota bacterium]
MKRDIRRAIFGIVGALLAAVAAAVADNLLRTVPPDVDGPPLAPVDSERTVTQIPGFRVETRERTFNVDFWNDHCSGPRNINWRIDADSEWQIQVESIRPTAYPDSDSTFHGLADVSSDGFTLRGRLVNGGEGCGPFRIWRDSRGHMRIRGTYIEERTVPAGVAPSSVGDTGRG